MPDHKVICHLLLSAIISCYPVSVRYLCVYCLLRIDEKYSLCVIYTFFTELLGLVYSFYMYFMGSDPSSYARCMFAFCNRRRTSIKILQWDGSGFWILMKRLDRNAFHWPDTPDELRQVTLKEIHWLCDGLSLNPRGAFEEHHPKIIL